MKKPIYETEVFHFWEMNAINVQITEIAGFYKAKTTFEMPAEKARILRDQLSEQLDIYDKMTKEADDYFNKEDANGKADESDK